MAYLQKYLDEGKLVSFIEDGLYFRKISKFEDKTEGDFQYFGKNQIALSEKIKNNPGFCSEDEAAKLLENRVAEEKKYLFLQSWHISNYMSGRMWKDYSKVEGDNLNGAIIVVDSISFTNSLLLNIPFGQKSGEVLYVDDKNFATDGVFSKNKETYDWEKEWRLFFDLREMLIFNNKILIEMSGLRSLRGVRINEGVNGFLDLNSNAHKFFVYRDENGFYFKLPGLNELVLNIFIPEKSPLEFSDRINECLEVNGWQKKIKRVNIACGLPIKEIIESGTCLTQVY